MLLRRLSPKFVAIVIICMLLNFADCREVEDLSESQLNDVLTDTSTVLAFLGLTAAVDTRAYGTFNTKSRIIRNTSEHVEKYYWPVVRLLQKHCIVHVADGRAVPAKNQHTFQVNTKNELSTPTEMRIVHITNSDTARQISTDLMPRLIFYRQMVPIVYDSKNIEHDEILTWMENNRELNTISLDNTNFEHLTQAASGATTGDWLVLFQKPSCNELMPIWEAVGSRLKHKMNVATVDLNVSPELKARFRITTCPAVIFFRHGKMFPYELAVHEVQSYVAFADGWYANTPSMLVPREPTPFDVLVDKSVSWIKDNTEPITQPLGITISLSTVLIALGILLVLTIFCIRYYRKPRKQKLY